MIKVCLRPSISIQIDESLNTKQKLNVTYIQHTHR